MERIKAVKVARIKAAADERIEAVEKLLGLKSDPICSKCKAIVTIFGHTEDCVLRRINPESLDETIKEVRTKAKKNINRQRIFRGERKRGSSGLPPAQGKSLVKRKGARRRGFGKELRHCHVCHIQTLFVNKVCNKCQHERPCTYTPLGTTCPQCYPEAV
jgi:hypothetical protein